MSPGADPVRLYAPFRPRLARVVTLVLAGLVAVLTVALAVLVPATGPAGFRLPDRVGVLATGALVVAMLWRQATVRAVPDPDGLTVRNLLRTQRLAWGQVVSVRFGRDSSWVQLDLDDGATLAVMGIQHADGARAQVQARRLATLVARHTRTGRAD